VGEAAEATAEAPPPVEEAEEVRERPPEGGGAKSEADIMASTPA